MRCGEGTAVCAVAGAPPRSPAAAPEPADAAPRYWPHRDNTLASAFTHALSPHTAALWHAFCGDRVGAREVTAVLYLSDWAERPAARALHDGREEVHLGQRSAMNACTIHTCHLPRLTMLADVARRLSSALPSALNPTARSFSTSAPPTTTSRARPRSASCASRRSAGDSCCSTRARFCTQSNRTAALTRTASRSRCGSAAHSARGASDTQAWVYSNLS